MYASYNYKNQEGLNFVYVTDSVLFFFLLKTFMYNMLWSYFSPSSNTSRYNPLSCSPNFMTPICLSNCKNSNSKNKQSEGGACDVKFVPKIEESLSSFPSPSRCQLEVFRWLVAGICAHPPYFMLGFLSDFNLCRYYAGIWLQMTHCYTIEQYVTQPSSVKLPLAVSGN